jgi:hypothetical protein
VFDADGKPAGPPRGVDHAGEVIKLPEPTNSNDRGHNRRRSFIISVGGWIGLAIGLINIYPTLLPWYTPLDKAAGIAGCALVTAIAARASVLFSRFQLDWILVALVAALVLMLIIAILALAEAGQSAVGQAQSATTSSAQVLGPEQRTDPTAGPERHQGRVHHLPCSPGKRLKT